MSNQSFNKPDAVLSRLQSEVAYTKKRRCLRHEEFAQEILKKVDELLESLICHYEQKDLTHPTEKEKI